MYELSQIILWILWTLRPAMAVETNLIDIIRSGFALFADDETLAAMSEDPAHCAIIAAATADAHAKLDLMIYLRACEIAGVRPHSRGFEPNFNTTSSRHTPETCWRSFRRLVLRFDDRERLAHLRAERLRREREASPLRLRTTCASTSPMLRMVEATSPLQLDARFASLSAQHWGRWIGASSRRDGGGARAPPSPFHFPKSDFSASHSPARTLPHATNEKAALADGLLKSV
jgi:hypothetical protein